MSLGQVDVHTISVNEDTNAINHYTYIFAEFRKAEQYDSSVFYGELAIEKAYSINHISPKVKDLQFQLGDVYFLNFQDLDKAIFYFEENYNSLDSIAETDEYLRVANNLSIFYSMKSENEKALDFAYRCHRVAPKNEINEYKSKSAMMLGIINPSHGNYEESLKKSL